MQQRILDHVSKTDYQPVKPKALARKLGVHDDDYPEFRDALKALIRDGKVLFGPGHSVKPAGQRDASDCVADAWREQNAVRLAHGQHRFELPPSHAAGVNAEHRGLVPRRRLYR